MNIERQRQYRKFLIIIVYLIMITWGIPFGISLEISPQREFLYSIVLALVLTQVCIVDSRIQGKPLPVSFYWLVFIFCGFAVPVCIIRAHGRRGIKYLITHVFGMWLAQIISAISTALFLGTLK